MKKVVFALAVLTGSGALWAGCSQNTAAVLVRSLERSGRAAFLCVRDPLADNPGQQMDACFQPGDVPPQHNYSIPHVISLVTQTARGEVAIVDVTSETVVDTDRSVPGFNFLPVGALPTDIVATPGGNASFVGIGDPVRPGIFAIATTQLPLWDNSSPPTFADWPACALPPGGVPTELLIVPDTTISATEPTGRRAFCDGSPAPPVQNPRFDLSWETQLFGRLKLVAMLPELGEIDVIDAQELLSRPQGSFEPCLIERRIPLTVDANLPPIAPQADAGADATAGDAASGDAASDDAADGDGGTVADAGTGGPGSSVDAGSDGTMCTGRVTPSAPPSLEPHPFGLALADDGRLYVSDDKASVIHVVDMHDPCMAEEKAPLLPFSAADPTRAVVSGAIAVSPLTSDGKRFVYASDIKNNGSLMVFDVSTTSTERTPIMRDDRLFNPLDAPDRVTLPAPIESMTFATHEVPLAKPDSTGVIPRGVPCDPTNAADPNRPPDDFVTAGAGPRRLRGTFGFVALASGDMSIIDVDDYDVACRRPRTTDDVAFGCGGATLPDALPSASQEVSCKVVERHRPRSANYVTNVTAAGNHAPAMLSYPVLYDKDGTAISLDPSRPETANLPKLLGPSLLDHLPDARTAMATVLSTGAVPDNGLSWNPNGQSPNWVAFDLREPRAHVTQNWYVTYEGTLPWFAGRRGRLQCAAEKDANECEVGDAPSHFEVFDSSTGFCDGGAQGEDMAPAGDIFEITDDMPDPADPYWSTVTNTCSRAACEEVFGTIDAPRVVDEHGSPVGRDIAIAKSYQGVLSLKRSETTRNSTRTQVPISCCFPYPVAYTIRARNQWIVTGSSTNFAHRLIPDPTETDPMRQACIESCDPNLALRNSRLLARTPDDPVPAYDDPSTFHNAQVRFVVWDMDSHCPSEPCAARVRDRFFSFQEVGGFVPLRFGLSSSSLVMPQSVRYVRGLQMLAIPDPVAMGLMLFDLNRLATTVSFY